MIEHLLKIYWFGFMTATSLSCLLITLKILLDKDRELLIYDKHDGILAFEVLLLLIGICLTFWFGVETIGGR